MYLHHETTLLIAFQLLSTISIKIQRFSVAVRKSSVILENKSEQDFTAHEWSVEASEEDNLEISEVA